ncbi:MAG: hypothetical protein JW768_09515 [Chitinispirillaceae bacterium]|nr:hypothetical protein [Chitinispirillaceae bacterium]
MNNSDAASKSRGQRSSRKISDPVKMLELLLAILLVAVLVITVAGFFPVSHPALGRKAETLIREMGADTCSVRKAAVALWKGIYLHDCFMAGRLDSTRSLAVMIEKGTFSRNCVSLLLDLMLRRGALAGIQRDLPGKHEHPAATIRACIGAAGKVPFRKVALDGTDLTVRRRDTLLAQVKEIGVQGDFADGKGPSVKGSLSAGSLMVAGVTTARRVRAQFKGDTNAFEVFDVKGTIFEGKMQCEGRIDLAQERLVTFTLSGKNLESGRWFSFADSSQGYFTGKVDVAVTLDSSDLHPDSIRGSGMLSAEGCTIKRYPFQKTLASLFSFPYFERARFSSVEASFSMHPPGMFSLDVQGKGDTVSVNLSGWFKTSGAMNARLECLFSRDGTRALPEFMRRTLEETSRGGRKVRCRIYGSIARPKFEIDSKKIIEKAVQNIFNDVRSNFNQWLK